MLEDGMMGKVYDKLNKVKKKKKKTVWIKG